MDTALQQLEDYVTTGNHIEDGLKLLQQIKITKITQPQSDNVVITDIQYIQALECGILLSIQAEDLDLFQKHIQQLLPLYNMINNNTVVLPRKNHMIGLNLMSLLVTASSSEFHSELELLSSSSSDNNKSYHHYLNDPYITFPITIERKFMVGIYDEILQMNVPHTSYQFFMDQLMNTVRDAIADCIEVSYTSLSIEQTAEIMKYNNNTSSEIQDLLQYIQESREDWIIDTNTNRITFQLPTTTGGHTSGITGQDVPSQQWIQQALTYANEMERII